MASRLSYCGEQVSRQDRDRFLCTLFAPDDRLEALWTLLAFNTEIARTREVISEPLLGEMRLQWWRDAIAAIYGDGQGEGVKPMPKGNQVLDALAAVIRDYDLPRAPFERMLDGRTAEVTDPPPADINAFAGHGLRTDGALNELLLRVLDPGAGEEGVAAAHAAGTAWSMAGRLRAVPFHARQGWVTLPQSVLSAHAVDAEETLRGRASAGLSGAVEHLAEEARMRIGAARRLSFPMPAAWQSVLLQARLAELYLDRLARFAHNPFDERLEGGRVGRQISLWISAKREGYWRVRARSRPHQDRSGPNAPPNRWT